MVCINCGSTNTEIFFVEAIPCRDCGGVSCIEYHICNDCLSFWKTLDGEYFHDKPGFPEVSVDNLPVFEFTEEDLDMVIDEFDAFVKSTEERPTMKDMIHHCIRCDALAFEVDPLHFYCPKCGFEWETLR